MYCFSLEHGIIIHNLKNGPEYPTEFDFSKRKSIREKFQNSLPFCYAVKVDVLQRGPLHH